MFSELTLTSTVKIGINQHWLDKVESTFIDTTVEKIALRAQ